MKPLSRLAVPAEFDEYADGYDAGMGNPIKRLVGSSPVDFLRVKIRWLLADIGKVTASRPLELLDYGCGSGRVPGRTRGVWPDRPANRLRRIGTNAGPGGEPVDAADNARVVPADGCRTGRS